MFTIEDYKGNQEYGRTYIRPPIFGSVLSCRRSEEENAPSQLYRRVFAMRQRAFDQNGMYGDEQSRQYSVYQGDARRLGSQRKRARWSDANEETERNTCGSNNGLARRNRMSTDG